MGVIPVPLGTYPVLEVRDFQSDFYNYTETFSSFDKCMTEAICKIPFIVGCVVLGVMLMCITSCLVRCIFCGYPCCSCCCGGCCGRRKANKHLLQPIGPAPIDGWTGRGVSPYRKEEPMQYAYGDARSSPGDALPIMPSLEKTTIAVMGAKALEAGYEMQAVKGGRTITEEAREISRTPSPASRARAPLTTESHLAPIRHGNGNGYRNPSQRPESPGASFYSLEAGSQVSVGHHGGGLAPPGHPAPGHRNTVQRDYTMSAINPYQYNYKNGPPMLREIQGPRDQHSARQEEWTVV